MMKKLITLTIVSFLSVCLFSQAYSVSEGNLQYPTDYFLYDTTEKFSIGLGSTIDDFVRKYGKPDTQELVQYNIDGRNQTWRYGYSFDFMIMVYNYDRDIFLIETSNSRFQTARQISVGDSLQKVLAEYGMADLVFTGQEGLTHYCYDRFIPEICTEAEYVSLRFEVDSKQTVQRIVLAIFY